MVIDPKNHHCNLMYIMYLIVRFFFEYFNTNKNKLEIGCRGSVWADENVPNTAIEVKFIENGFLMPGEEGIIDVVILQPNLVDIKIGSKLNFGVPKRPYGRGTVKETLGYLN